MIHYRNAVRRSGVNGRALVATTRKLLAAIGEANSSLSLTIVGDPAIRRLNRDHRSRDRATDVLSFPIAPPGRAAQPPRAARAASPRPPTAERLLGDVVISVDTARRQAAAYDSSLQRELYRLLIHGLLHVVGHDHEAAGERRAMEREERRLAASIGLPWPYKATG